MPRTARRTQPPAAPQDQDYGQSGEQLAAQHAVPLPDNRATVAPTPLPGAGESTPAPGAGSPMPQLDPRALAMYAASQIKRPTPQLGAPSARPMEPVTAGLPSGPGPGPEALGTQPIAPDKVAEVLAIAGQVTGNQRLIALAQRRR